MPSVWCCVPSASNCLPANTTFSPAEQVDEQASEDERQSITVGGSRRAGAATTSPATGTILTAALVARTGNATTPQPGRLVERPAARASKRIAPTRWERRKLWVTYSTFLPAQRRRAVRVAGRLF